MINKPTPNEVSNITGGRKAVLQPAGPTKRELVNKGKDGLGIKTATVNDAGHLILTYTDNSTVDAGNVQGPTGTDGSVDLEHLSMRKPYGTDPATGPQALFVQNASWTTSSAGVEKFLWESVPVLGAGYELLVLATAQDGSSSHLFKKVVVGHLDATPQTFDEFDYGDAGFSVEFVPTYLGDVGVALWGTSDMDAFWNVRIIGIGATTDGHPPSL